MDTNSPKRKIVANCESPVPRKKGMRTFELKEDSSSENEFIEPHEVIISTDRAAAELRRSAPSTSNVEKIIPTENIVDFFKESMSSADAGSELSSTTDQSDSNVEDVAAEVRSVKYSRRFIYDVEEELTCLKITEPSISKVEGISAEIGNASGFEKITSAVDVNEPNLENKELSNVDHPSVSEESDPRTKKSNLAEELEEEYMRLYSRQYTKDLLFAVDVMNLVKHLNRQKYQPILFPNTKGNLPSSPVDGEFEDAISVSWKHFADETEKSFNSFITSGMDYGMFQNVAEIMARSSAEIPYSNRTFLAFCVIVAHFAALALNRGLERAPYFSVLVICSIIQNHRESGEFPPWEEVIEFAKRESS